MLVAGCADDEDSIRLVAQDLDVSTAEDTPLFVRVPTQANRPVQVRLTTPPTHGTLEDMGGGLFQYTPTLNYNGADTATLTVTAGTKVATATAHITVTPVNDAPAAAPDSFAGQFAGQLTVAHSTLLANDTDIDSDTSAFRITEVQPGTHGTVAMSDTSVTFTAESGFTGVATFVYRVSDGTSSTIGTVTVTVGANGTPAASNDVASATEDSPLTIASATLLGNDTDPDQQTLAIASVSNPTHGTVSLFGGVIRFTPEPDYAGAASFEYLATDGAATDSATVTVTVLPVNDAPAAVDNVTSTLEDTMLTVTGSTLVGNDTDVEADNLSVTGVSGATHGTVALAGGTIAFSPALNFSGVAGFDYTVSDGTLTAVGHVVVTVGAVNDPPLAVDDTDTGIEDTVVLVTTTSILIDDVDVEGEPLAIVAATNAVNGTVAITTGGVSFTPNANYFGPASFSYTVSDGQATDTGLVTLTIVPANDAPTTVADVQATDEDVALSFAPLANDVDVDGDTFTVISISQPSNGTATHAGNVVAYTPAANYFGSDQLTYVAMDSQGASSTGTVSLTVRSVNDAPIAVPDEVLADEDTSIITYVLVNDTDVEGDTLSLVSVADAPRGTTAIVNGQVLYTPNTNYNGPDSFVYTVADGNGGQSQGIATITVRPVNDVPVAVDDDLVVTSGELVIGANGVLANDLGADGNSLNAELVEGPSNGTLQLDPNGGFTYTPFQGCVFTDTFTYRATDGSLVSNVATVRLTLNTAPVANNDRIDQFGCPQPYFATPGVLLSVPADGVLANDSECDFGDTLTAILVSPPNNAVTFQLAPSGAFVYQSNVTGYDSFTYQVSDGHTLSNIAEVTIFVGGFASTQGGFATTASAGERGYSSIAGITCGNFAGGGGDGEASLGNAGVAREPAPGFAYSHAAQCCVVIIDDTSPP